MFFLWAVGCSESELIPVLADPPVDEPDIQVEPETLHFPSTAVGCPVVSTVLVRNVGEATLDLTGVHVEGSNTAAEFSVESPRSLLVPGLAQEVNVRFAPDALGEFTARLDVTSDDPDDPHVYVPIVAAGLDASKKLDIFHQDPQAIDVLWVIDNSGSMAQEKDRITAQIDEFIAWFDQLSLDYHMGVITTDVVNPIFQGQLVGDPTFVSPETPNAAGILAAAIQFDGIEMGNEAGLQAMEWALTEPLLSGANAGFYRDDARLMTIFVTDEPEQSAETADHYISFLNSLKADPTNIFVASIVGDRQRGCATSCGATAQTADPGDKYLDVTEAFPGFEQSICTCNLAPALERMGFEATWYARTFTLTDHPSDPTTIGVWIDGVEASGWTYDAVANTIVFDTAPLAGATVVARYRIATACQ